MTAGWFILVTFGGWLMAPGGFVAWSLPSVPLTYLTFRWLALVGHPVGRSLQRAVWLAWAALLAVLLVLAALLLQQQDAVAFDSDALLLALNVLYAAPPLWLTGWVIRRALQVAHGGRVSPPDSGAAA
jgi:hypothetical protein